MIIKYYQSIQQPQFKEPTIERNENQLTVTNPTANGDFANSVSIYADGELLVSVGMAYSRTFNLDLYSFETERRFELSAKMDSTKEIRESGNSNTNEYGILEAPTVSMDGNYLLITNNSNYATAFDIYSNEGFVATITSNEKITSVSVLDLLVELVGFYAFTVKAKNTVDTVWRTSAISDGEAIFVKAADLSKARQSMVSGSVGEYALFAGGQTGNLQLSSVVDAYDDEASLIIPSELPKVLQANGNRSANVGDYILISGVQNSVTADYLNQMVIPYDNNLTLHDYEQRTKQRKYHFSGSVGEYALFAGGIYDNEIETSVNVYNANLTRTDISEWGTARYSGGSANAGGNLLLAGGYSLDESGVAVMNATVDVYTESLTRTTATSMPNDIVYSMGGSVGEYALFAGGQTSNGFTAEVVAYDAELTQITGVTALSLARPCSDFTSFKDCAFFVGADDNYSGAVAIIDVYDADLVKTNITSSFASQMQSAASNNRCLIVAGGYANSSTLANTYTYF